MSDPCEIVSEYLTASDSTPVTIESRPTTVATLAAVATAFVSATASAGITVSNVATNNSAAYVEESLTLANGYDIAHTVAGVARATLRVSSSATVQVNDTLAENLTLSASAEGGNPVEVVGTALTITSAVYPDATPANVASSTLTASSAVYGVKAVYVAESLTVTDAARDSRVVAEIVGATLTASSTATLHFQAVATSTLRVSSAAYNRPDPVEIATSTLTVSAALRYGVDARIAEALTATTEAHAGGQLRASLVAEVLHAESSASARVTAVHILRESLVVSGLVHADGTEFGAYSAPTETFAMSRWETMALESVVEIGGQLFAGGPTGLYRMDAGADDPDADIDASVRHGLSDFGVPNLKRASYAYLGWRGDGGMRLTMGCVPQSSEESYSYEIERSAADSHVPARIRLGRGARSRYWRMTLENVGGADFEVIDQRLMLDELSRKY